MRSASLGLSGEVGSSDLVSMSEPGSSSASRVRSLIKRSLSLLGINSDSNVRVRLDSKIDRVRENDGAIRNHDRLFTAESNMLEGAGLNGADTGLPICGQCNCDSSNWKVGCGKLVRDANADFITANRGVNRLADSGVLEDDIRTSL